MHKTVNILKIMGSSSAAELSIVVSVKVFSSSEQYRKKYILKLPRNNHYKEFLSSQSKKDI